MSFFGWLALRCVRAAKEAVALLRLIGEDLSEVRHRVVGGLERVRLQKRGVHFLVVRLGDGRPGRSVGGRRRSTRRSGGARGRRSGRWSGGGPRRRESRDGLQLCSGI